MLNTGEGEEPIPIKPLRFHLFYLSPEETFSIFKSFVYLPNFKDSDIENGIRFPKTCNVVMIRDAIYINIFECV